MELASAAGRPALLGSESTWLLLFALFSLPLLPVVEPSV